MIKDDHVLGPFIGHTTSHSAKIWIYTKEYKKLILKIFSDDMHEQPPFLIKEFNLNHEIPADCVELTDLTPNSQYYYQIWTENNLQLKISDLEDKDCFFWTMPADLDHTTDALYQYNFLVLSCHDPFKNKKTGWYVWETMPQILNKQKNRVLFAILTGDQTYADSQEKNNLNEKMTPRQRIDNYLEIYKKYWGNKAYRKILCSLPAYLMWDDHDITDGWGSREDSFEGDSKEFKPNWQNLFDSAKTAFSTMQASRNPSLLSSTSFDTAFTMGKMGFVLADLRSNRNIKKKQIWSSIQFENIKKWIEAHREKIDILFFVSPVVFAHGDPKTENRIIKIWDKLHHGIDKVWYAQQKLGKYSKFLLNIILFIIYAGGLIFWPWLTLFIFILSITTLKFFNSAGYLFAFLYPPKLIEKYYDTIGDLRDDINDSWSADIHNEETEAMLSYLFNLQNDQHKEKQVYVTVLTGDIHSAGYSNLYSSRKEHQNCPVIHQIVASPVAYSPFPWIAEAFYRSQTVGAVKIGSSGDYTAQIAHHFTYRNVVICSVRNYGKDALQLKAKYYIEKFPEPSTSVFDLERNSGLEKIQWKAD